MTFVLCQMEGITVTPELWGQRGLGCVVFFSSSPAVSVRTNAAAFRGERRVVPCIIKA